MIHNLSRCSSQIGLKPFKSSKIDHNAVINYYTLVLDDDRKIELKQDEFSLSTTGFGKSVTIVRAKQSKIIFDFKTSGVCFD